MLIHIIIFSLFITHINCSFLLGNEGWTIIGNKRTSEAKHKPYSLGPHMSNYILGTDDLVNVDFENRDDRNLWYFKSPLLKIPRKTIGIIFTMTSFAGDFTNPNRVSPFIRIGETASFYCQYNLHFDGNMKTFIVPFVETVWKTPIPFNELFLEPVSIEILGDWTRGIETIAIDNVEFY